MARPASKYNRGIARRVQEMSGYGMPQEAIANLVGLCPKVLRRLYKHELEIGMAVADMHVCKRLYEAALAGDRAALIFLAKCRFGWRTEAKEQPLAIVAALREAFTSVG